MNLHKALSAKSGAATIEQEISSVLEFLTSTADKGLVIVREKTPKGKACKGVISVYFRDDLKLQAEERAAHARAKREGTPMSKLSKPFTARPAASYVFYPSTFFPSLLGSVAIYGANTAVTYATLRKSGVLFGHAIKRLSLETGVRPYVDVTVRI